MYFVYNRKKGFQSPVSFTVSTAQKIDGDWCFLPDCRVTYVCTSDSVFVFFFQKKKGGKNKRGASGNSKGPSGPNGGAKAANGTGDDSTAPPAGGDSVSSPDGKKEASTGKEGDQVRGASRIVAVR